MRKLYYNIKIIRTNQGQVAEQCGFQYSRSDGFLKVEYDGNGIKNIEGLLNLDYICSNINKDKIEIKYFIPSKDFKSLREDVIIKIKLDELEIPLNCYTGNDICMIQITTISKISDVQTQKYYEEELEKFKKTAIFLEERV